MVFREEKTMKIHPVSSEQSENEDKDDAIIETFTPEKTQTRIEEIRETLHHQLAISTKRIKLLDEIRKREDKRATQEETHHLQSRESFYSLAPATTEMIALMLEAKAEKRRQKHSRYEPFLINDDDILGKWALEINIAKLVSEKQPFRYDFILKTDVHCSPMQIYFDGKRLRLFYIDAIGDPKNHAYASSFQQTNPGAEAYMFTGGGIQFDHSSCAIFSLQHLNNLSNRSLEERATLATTPGKLKEPFALAPVFLKNIQTTSKLDKYYKRHANATIDKQGTKSIKEHIDDYSITVDISTAGEGSITKTQNHALAYKNHKYLHAALTKLDQLSIIETENIINARCDVSGKNAVASHMGYYGKANVIQAIVDMNDQVRIKELIKHAIEKNKPELLLELIKLNVRLNAAVGPVSMHGRYINITPIAWAIATGNIEITRKLLDLTSDKTQDCLGVPYLQNTVSNYYITPNALEMTTFLVNHGAKIKHANASGNTIVDTCIASRSDDSLNILHTLIQLGAVVDVRSVNREGNTLLLTAKRLNVIEFLIQLGADVHFKNNRGHNLLNLVMNKPFNYQHEEIAGIQNALTGAGLSDLAIKNTCIQMKEEFARLKKKNKPQNPEGGCCNIM